MRLGKTLTALAIAGAAYKMGKIDKVLIVAPTSVVAVWPKEFQEFADFKYTCRTLLGDKTHRLRELSDLQKFPFKAMKVAVINYESTWREGIFEALQEYDADLIICDESQRIKTHDAEQSKALHKLGDQARYKLILSNSIVNAATEAVYEAVELVALANKAMQDLYRNSSCESTPLEDYMDEQENDGFEEAEDASESENEDAE